MELSDNVMISVLISAYNQEEFLEDAINGVISQETDYTYELLIIDDASQDSTPDIIRKYEKEYPQIIKGILRNKNQFQQGKISNIYPYLKGKYLALCDGDDYWTDKKKLQKQVDFLETHEEYSMCMHNAIKLNYATGEKMLLNTFPKEGTYSQEEQIRAGLGTDFPASASYVYRTELYKDIPDFFLEVRAMDYSVRQYYANCGKVYYFNEPMSVYRVWMPNSYMKNARQDQLRYNNYTVEMIRFFEKFDHYTERRFHDILMEKIVSDYFGYCTSIDKEEGILKAKENCLDMDRVEECYRSISETYINPSILKLNKSCDVLFIYGTSRVAEICRKQLEHSNIKYQGYVVSDGQTKVDEIEGKKVYYLSEIISECHNPGFILALQPVNLTAVIPILKEHNIEKYCTPYQI